MNDTTYIRVTVRIDPGEEDEGGFVAHCEELGVSSQGETIDEALGNIQEALEEFIGGLYELGDLETFLKEHGVEVYDQLPSEKSTVELSRGEVVSSLVATLGKTVAFV